MLASKTSCAHLHGDCAHLPGVAWTLVRPRDSVLLSAILTTFLLSLPLFAAPYLPGVTGIQDPIAQTIATVRELRCADCHASHSSLELDPGWAPKLNGVARRLEPEWIRRYLADPHATESGSRMPDVLNESTDEDREALMQFLHSFKQPPQPGKGFRQVVSRSRGEALFNRIGCAACHAPGSLDIRGKWNLFHLMDFLQDPLVVRPDGRMPDMLLQDFEAADLAAYLLEFPRSNLRDDKAPPAPPHDPELAAQGKNLFASLGCANCHDLGVQATLQAPALRSLPSRTACTHADYDGADLNLDLALLQEKVLRKHQLHSQLGGLQCQACHTHDGLSSQVLDASKHLFTGDASLADAGKFPPSLNGVQDKLKATWVAGIVGSRENRLRSYIQTRMPNFGAAAAKRLVPHMSTFERATGDDDPSSLYEEGRTLVGAKGMNCITCHDIGEWKSIGIPGMNLAQIDQRLKRTWFKEYLENPGAYRLGTLMPAFWPKGVSSRPDLLTKSDERWYQTLVEAEGADKGLSHYQMEALWAYLQHPAKQAEGYPPEKGAYEIMPEDAPVVMRTFMKHTGTHALAIGFPGGVNLVYDTKACQITELWKGKFLDGYNTWFVRFTPPNEPLGTDHVTIPKKPSGAARFKGYEFTGSKVRVLLDGASDQGFSVQGNRLILDVDEGWTAPKVDGVSFDRVEKRELPSEASMAAGTAERQRQLPALQKRYEVRW